ncbi:adenosylmethionine decarboxylase [Haliovirga abyssi]|uniref:S-adenosylmethionine decarboxylase proenzyme n=1 Tax=Haliovirga abyssi TaxID=2996794 RepID=A0AAU9D8E4_9FUSO|nr:adenosylmethionine decarboxylase [Haliovirga abyssi]BDU50868.1 S-adenosylmethionine decarboxylase proenzyme [Haliovirga abyssi]
MKSLGKHLIIEFFDCDDKVLSNLEGVENAMNQAAIEAKSTIVNSVFHHFSPYGVSGAVIIAESHITIHTWPEYGYAAVDIFTCGEEVEPYKAYEYLKEKFNSKSVNIKELNRGELDIENLKVKVS